MTAQAVADRVARPAERPPRRLLADVRALGASSLKEWRIARRYPHEFASLVFWPLVMPGVFLLQANGFGAGEPHALSAFAGRSGTSQVAGFLYLGGIMYLWISILLWGPGTSLRREQERGSLEALFLSPASRLVLLFGPAPASLIPTAWVFAVVMLTLRLGFGIPIQPGELLRAAAVVLLAIPALFGISALFSAAVVRFREIRAGVLMARGLCQLVCGIAFPVAVLPRWAQALALALPPTHVLADLRAVLLAGAHLSDLGPSLAVLAVMALLCCAAGAAAFWRTEAAARRTGSLGQH